MSVLTDPLAQMETAVADMETRVSQRVEEAEKKVADIPDPQELARLTALIEKIKALPH